MDAGRWAPSGDNAQPWTFEVSGGTLVGLKIFCDPDNVYEYNSGEPTLIAAGMLLENMRIAAAMLGRRLTWTYRGAEGAYHRIALSLAEDAARPDPLYGAIYTRSVDRRPYQRRPLEAADKQALAAAAGNQSGGQFRLDWFESADQRRAIAKLMAIGTDIRLRIPETFEIHRRIVDWNRKLSPRGIPAAALGLDAMTVKMMRWSLAKKARTDLSNALGSPAMASLQMDRLPAMASAAFFSFRLPTRPAGPDQFFQVGQAVQRFWLAATTRGLVIQPSFAPLAFSWYGRQDAVFTTSERGRRSARTLAGKMESFFPHAEELVFLGRIGWPKPNLSPARSTRADLSQLVEVSG